MNAGDKVRAKNPDADSAFGLAKISAKRQKRWRISMINKFLVQYQQPRSELSRSFYCTHVKLLLHNDVIEHVGTYDYVTQDIIRSQASQKVVSLVPHGYKDGDVASLKQVALQQYSHRFVCLKRDGIFLSRMTRLWGALG